MTPDDLAAHARALLDTNRFLTLGTVDPDGRPWTSPVYFATSGLREFYWSSRPTPCTRATSPNART
jgi:predicted pyridoxine 5'-phosphate oxidase superfamily flavin-nucleotide-binding protein